MTYHDRDLTPPPAANPSSLVDHLEIGPQSVTYTCKVPFALEVRVRLPWTPFSSVNALPRFPKGKASFCSPSSVDYFITIHVEWKCPSPSHWNPWIFEIVNDANSQEHLHLQNMQLMIWWVFTLLDSTTLPDSDLLLLDSYHNLLTYIRLVSLNI